MTPNQFSIEALQAAYADVYRITIDALIIKNLILESQIKALQAQVAELSGNSGVGADIQRK